MMHNALFVLWSRSFGNYVTFIGAGVGWCIHGSSGLAVSQRRSGGMCARLHGPNLFNGYAILLHRHHLCPAIHTGVCPGTPTTEIHVHILERWREAWQGRCFYWTEDSNEERGESWKPHYITTEEIY